MVADFSTSIDVRNIIESNRYLKNIADYVPLTANEIGAKYISSCGKDEEFRGR